MLTLSDIAQHVYTAARVFATNKPSLWSTALSTHTPHPAQPIPNVPAPLGFPADPPFTCDTSASDWSVNAWRCTAHLELWGVATIAPGDEWVVTPLSKWPGQGYIHCHIKCDAAHLRDHPTIVLAFGDFTAGDTSLVVQGACWSCLNTEPDGCGARGMCIDRPEGMPMRKDGASTVVNGNGKGKEKEKEKGKAGGRAVKRKLSSSAPLDQDKASKVSKAGGEGIVLGEQEHQEVDQPTQEPMPSISSIHPLHDIVNTYRSAITSAANELIEGVTRQVGTVEEWKKRYLDNLRQSIKVEEQNHAELHQLQKERQDLQAAMKRDKKRRKDQDKEYNAIIMEILGIVNKSLKSDSNGDSTVNENSSSRSVKGGLELLRDGVRKMIEKGVGSQGDTTEGEGDESLDDERDKEELEKAEEERRKRLEALKAMLDTEA